MGITIVVKRPIVTPLSSRPWMEEPITSSLAIEAVAGP